MSNYKQELNNSAAIRQEIQRFEGVHPNIYAVYELLQRIPDHDLQNQIRDHIINIEDSFVNSQEWTLSKSVPEIKLGILGSVTSGKSALVHRYLTGSYVREESPEGGRFKKEVVVDGQSFLLLIRDEGGPPEIEFSNWVDGVIFVFSLDDETSFHAIYNYYRRLVQHRSLNNLPLVLVGTQDSICSERPRVIFDDRAKKLANDLKRCVYYESCSTYGLNVDHVFHDISHKISTLRRKLDYVTPPSGHLSTPTTPLHRSASTSSAIYHNNGMRNGSGKSLHGGESSLSISSLLTPTPLRKSSRRKSNLFSGRKASDSEEKRRLNDLGFGRNIPVKQGWLMKRTSKGKISNKEWKKKYVALEDEGNLTYYSNMHDYMENINKKSLSVVKTTIKVPGKHPAVATKSSPTSKTDENSEFHLISMDGISWQFLSSCSVERDEWVTAIERQIMISLQNISSTKPNPCKRLFNEIAGNTMCVDCGAPDPTWVSLNLGCLMCIECSGIHRNLGTHISRVRSLELDDWPVEFTKILDKTGNLIANSIWEGLLNNDVMKPDPHGTRDARESFIRDKYERKLFLPKLPAKYAADISSSLCYAIADGNSQLTMHLLAHASRDDVNRSVGSERQAPLHVASSVADLAVVQLLLWSRADPTQLDALNQTPISIAEQNGHWECHRVMQASLSNNLPQSSKSRNNSTRSESGRPNVNYMYTSAI
uniref:arf-GAP with GTPase, ANK repeat and PH domain-containing protein 3 isoform X1 n=1 Tax=Ciona intestinalis TaxID=7719 RepID=UPI000052293A|nr:arf-GAP with GTPase, ANK repeat and PH domain-containing protein 3 isoform X1 [Ciona intestinalis]|eukprot:XP_002127442.1 arf-GAP with GTPase, ANK repeat and PH domain-containing protein 3 isoform X1 [Ciona intestinalis]